MPTSTVTQQAKGEAFRALHERAGTFFIPNPWDAGTARILTALGFEALTTTSAGLAWSLGRRDGARLMSRDETLANARAIVEATDLPVAADLENGFGDAPETAATTIPSPRIFILLVRWSRLRLCIDSKMVAYRCC